MNILYIGDIMGATGVKVVERILPSIRKQYAIDMVIAQAENVTDGKGISLADFKKLRSFGIDFCTGGNWTLHNSEIHSALSNPKQPIIRPANYPEGTPGVAYKTFDHATGSVLIVSLLGSIVGKDSSIFVDNPLKVIDKILEETNHSKHVATIVNFHGDFSSEKRIIGYYLDGRVTAVVGDHWHVPTADAMVLPDGTAHITDVGMCGSLHSSLGVNLKSVIPRWRDGKITKNVIDASKPYQFNAVLIESNNRGLADSIEHIQRHID